MKQLTDKQRAFVAAKQAGCTNRDAAIAAGYSVAAASTTADKLMANPAIRKELKEPAKVTPGIPDMPRKHYADSLSFLQDVMNHASLPIAVRADAAKQLLPYQHARMGEQGKKEKAKDRAHKVAGGKFTPKRPPQLTVVPKE